MFIYNPIKTQQKCKNLTVSSDNDMNDAISTVTLVPSPLRDHRVVARRLAPRDPPEEEERDTETDTG